MFGINGCLIDYIFFYIAYYLSLCYKLPAPLELTQVTIIEMLISIEFFNTIVYKYSIL